MLFARNDFKALESLFNGSADPIAIACRRGGPVRLNPAWQEVLGWTTEELAAASLLHFVHFDDIPSMLKIQAQRILPGTKLLQGEIQFLHKAGDWRTFEFHATSTDDYQCTIYRDISDGVAAEVADLNSIVELIAELENVELTGGNLRSRRFSTVDRRLNSRAAAK